MPTSPLFPSAIMDIKKREKKEDARGGELHPEPPAQAVITEAGRCTCCPYGYHIDLDFLNFCKSITNGSALSNLKRIQRTKRKLRKSMEFMLQQQQPPAGQEGASSSSSLPASIPPPDVVNSTEASRLMHMVSYEQSATNQVLKDIDSAVNATLASIDSMRRTKPASHRYPGSSDSEESSIYSPASPLSASVFAPQQSQFEGFPAQPPVPPPRRSSLRYAHHSEGEDVAPGRKDSMSSASSVSTVSSEQVPGAGPHWNGAHSAHSSYSSSHSLYASESSGFVTHQHAERQGQAPSMSAESLAAAMATHFPQKESTSQESPSTPMSPNTTISKASLAAIREAMAVSLQRMRDLEEQVKAIPILQVRISVLKEEKRLLALQLRAKSGNVTTRSVGVGGEEAVDSSPSSFSKSYAFFSTATHGAKSPRVRTPPPTLPKPRCRADVGVGEHSVVEPYLLQPALPCGYTITDNQVEHEIRKKSDDQHSSSSLNGAAGTTNKADRATPTQNHHKSLLHLQHSLPRTAVRSIGVGEGNVHTPQPPQIHNTEVRTVIIGANNSSSPVVKRNVGVEVKVPSRSVGVLFSSEEVAPTKRAVGVNVSVDSLHRLDSGGEKELGTALQKALQRQVKTVGTHCNIRPVTVNTGVQHGSDSGAGGHQVKEDGGVVPQCCVGTMAKADTQDGSVNTEKDWELVRVRGEKEGGRDQAVSTTTTTTTPTHQNDASTCTEPPSASQLALQTEVAVFEAMGAVSSTGSNTAIVPLTHSSSNTTALSTAEKSISITSSDLFLVDHKATSTESAPPHPPHKATTTCDRGVNTSCREPVLCMSRVECVEIAGDDAQPAKSSPARPLTMQEHILQRGADQAFAFLGSTSSAGSLSPTSPKKLPAGAHQDPDSKTDSAASAAAAGGEDECFTSGDADVGFTQQSTAACLQASSNVGLLSEEHTSEVKTEQTESVDLPKTSMRMLDGLTDTVTTKQSSGRLFRHRNSDGARIAQELDARPGIFSGRRVGSVEDFMPEEMRRLMNLDTVESDSSKPTSLAADLSSSPSGKTFSKTVRTITTKQTQQECSSSSTTSLTDTAAEQEEDSDEEDVVVTERKSFTKLSAGHLDLSQIPEDMGTGQEEDSAELSSPSECSESEGIKDSGYDDSAMVHNGAESSSLQGLDFSSMGSLERKELKSIMKTSKSDSPNPKKGISFAESVVGGTGSSSEDERTESDGESTTSYEEGSYDGREGDITYHCEDDEAIAQGLPGAKMYDQNIRETYELSEEMSTACQVLANYLVDSTNIQTKELNTNQSVVQEEWFRVSSHKLSSVHQVEDYLSSINEISPRLLQYVVNLVDSNGNAAIHYCVSHCNFDIVGLLLDTEVCDVKKPNKAGYTPAMLASLAFIQNDDHRDIIRQLFVAGHINAQAEKTGQTALMLATSQCRADMVELLVETGADCNLQDFDGSTALMCACEHGHAAIVQLLLAQPSCDATLTDNEGSTALSIAMEAGHKDIGVILYKYLNFTAPGLQKKRKGSSSPTPSVRKHLYH